MCQVLLQVKPFNLDFSSEAGAEMLNSGTIICLHYLGSVEFGGLSYGRESPTCGVTSNDVLWFDGLWWLLLGGINYQNR